MIIKLIKNNKLLVEVETKFDLLGWVLKKHVYYKNKKQDYAGYTIIDEDGEKHYW